MSHKWLRFLFCRESIFFNSRGSKAPSQASGSVSGQDSDALSFSLSRRQRIPRISRVGSPLYLGSPVVYAKTISLKRYWYLAAVSAILASVFWSSAWLNSMIELRPRL